MVCPASIGSGVSAVSVSLIFGRNEHFARDRAESGEQSRIVEPARRDLPIDHALAKFGEICSWLTSASNAWAGEPFLLMARADRGVPDDRDRYRLRRLDPGDLRPLYGAADLRALCRGWSPSGRPRFEPAAFSKPPPGRGGHGGAASGAARRGDRRDRPQSSRCSNRPRRRLESARMCISRPPTRRRCPSRTPVSTWSSASSA